MLFKDDPIQHIFFVVELCNFSLRSATPVTWTLNTLCKNDVTCTESPQRTNMNSRPGIREHLMSGKNTQQLLCSGLTIQTNITFGSVVDFKNTLPDRGMAIGLILQMYPKR